MWWKVRAEDAVEMLDLDFLNILSLSVLGAQHLTRAVRAAAMTLLPPTTPQLHTSIAH